MYCQHCGLEVKISEKKLKKEHDALKTLKTNELTSLESELKTVENSDKKAELEAKILDVKKELADLDHEYYAYDKSIKKVYVCPRCSHLIKEGLDEEDKKELSQASHAALHRGKNHFASGMVFLMLGAIFTAISFLFYSMSFKATSGYQLVTNCVEFYVFIGLLIIGIILLTIGAVNTIKGTLTTKKYRKLLNDIQNDTFYQ